MSIKIRDGQLGRTIRSAGPKLVAVDFSNPGCPPCRMIHPFWESLVQQYRNVVFCTVECNDCPTEAQEYRISATPTFVFILQGKEVHRIQGADKNAILATIEKYKGAGGFSGSGHTLGDGPAPTDFFAQLQRQRDAKLAGEKPGAAPAPTPTPTPSAPAPAPVQPPPQPVVREIPQSTKELMLEMGFEEELVMEAFHATASKNSTVDAMLEYIDIKQNHPEQLTPPEPAPNSKEARVANDLQRPLDEAGEAAKAELVKMGYDPELAHMAINVAGAQNLPGCIDIIGKIERGEPIPMPKHKLTKEELDQKAAHYRELLAQKRAEEYEKKEAPKAKAKSEIERRKEVLENLEQKKKLEEMKREQELRDAQKERIREKLEREKVRQRIAAQRAAQKKDNQPAPAAPQHAAPPKSTATECTLKLVLPDGSSLVEKFQPTDRMADVGARIQNARPELRGRNLGFEMTFPRRLIQRSEYSMTLVDLQLMPRAQLMVKFL